MVRPKLRQSLSTVLGTVGDEEGQICLRWTSTPTDFGFQIERCDIGEGRGFKRIAWLPDNTMTTYKDQTNCDLIKHVCQGHYYTVAFRDTAWSIGAGVLSKKLFCMSSSDPICESEVEEVHLLQENSEICLSTPIIHSDSDLTLSEEPINDRITEDDPHSNNVLPESSIALS